MSIKQLKPTSAPIPNPLWQYASSTYAWSMWFLSMSDADALAASTDLDAVTSWKPTTVDILKNPTGVDNNTSFVIAEDSGLYPNYRVPGFGVNYNIQSVEFDTTFSHVKQFRSSNSIVGTIKILEPYGITFIESLIAASIDWSSTSTPNYKKPYTQCPYMLQLEFFGYDDTGAVITPSASARLTKRFPITITTCKIQLTNAGAEYTITFAPWSHQGHNVQYGKLPKAVNIGGGTVGEILKDLETQINQFYIDDQKNAANAIYADQYKFNVDPDIAKATIVNNLDLRQSNPNSDTLDFTKKNVPIPKDTEILAIIDRIFAQSSYLTVDQLQLGSSSSPSSSTTAGNQGNPVNVFRTQVSVRVQGAQNAVGNATASVDAIDPQRNQFPFLITYNIAPYVSFKAESPWAPNLADSSVASIKDYQYLYTGKNIDIIDFKLNFNVTYYNAAAGYADAIAGVTPTAQSAVNTVDSDLGSTKVTPAILTLGYGPFQSTPNLTPAKYKFQVANANLQTGGGISNDPNAHKGMDVLASIYSSMLGDMVSLDLEILGDPVFIKQDDWLYSSDPTNTNSIYNQWDTVNQNDFFNSYGHIRTDISDVVISLSINTPIDIDIDTTNAGLISPTAGSRPSKFSGYYKVITVKNTFKNGKFTQTLKLVRYINQDLIKSYYSQGAENLTNTGGSNNVNGTNASTSTPANGAQQVIAGPAWTGPTAGR